MLIKVTVENFKSFSEQTEMTMISSTKIQKGTDHRVKIKSTNILKYAVIYGANAAGKSNLIDFFWFLKSTLNDTIPMVATKWFCKCKEENINKNSSFEIQFTIGDKFYAYGFTALLNQRRITSEWLYELYQNGNAKCLFERNEEEKFPHLGEDVKLNKIDEAKFKTYTDDFDGNESILFLTEMNRNKKYSEDSKLVFFKEVYSWLSQNIIIVKPNTSFDNFQYYNDETSLELINKLIKTFDTGIDKVRVEKN